MGNSPKVDGHAATRRVRLSALRRNAEKLAKVDVFVPESSSFANFLLFAWTTSLHTALPHEVERCGRVWAHAHTISVEAVRIGVMMPSYAILCGQILVCSKMKSGDARGGAHHTRLPLWPDSQINYWIVAQETRQKSAIGHVSDRKATGL